MAMVGHLIDLSDEEQALTAPLLPAPKTGSMLNTVGLHEVVDVTGVKPFISVAETLESEN